MTPTQSPAAEPAQLNPLLVAVNAALDKLGGMNIPADPFEQLSWLLDFAGVLELPASLAAPQAQGVACKAAGGQCAMPPLCADNGGCVHGAAPSAPAASAQEPVAPPGWALEHGSGWTSIRNLSSQCGQDFYSDRDPLIFAFLRAMAAAPLPQAPAATLPADFERECSDTDKILSALGLDPEECRTDGGSLILQRILGAISARPAAVNAQAEREPLGEATTLTDEMIESVMNPCDHSDFARHLRRQFIESFKRVYFKLHPERAHGISAPSKETGA